MKCGLVFDKYERMEIHTRCLRDTKNDQLWEAYATYQGKVGPTVTATSRKKARTKARTTFVKTYPELRREL